MRIAWMVFLVPEMAVAQGRVDEGSVGIVLPPEGVEAWAWDTDGDGAFDDCLDVAGCPFDATELDGPTEVAVDVYIVDDDELIPYSITIDNVPPEIASEPGTAARVGIEYRYALVATDPAAERDPITVDLVDGSFPAGMLFDGTDVYWTPDAGDVGDHGVLVRVSDGDGGEDEQAWTISVGPNAAPGAPTAEPFVGCFALGDSLFGSNGFDPDGDPVDFFFELDTDPGFRSIDLQVSGAIPAYGEGFAEWTPPRPLVPSATYYWRVWVSDGAFESERVTNVFESCPDYYDDYDDYDYDYDYDGYDYYGDPSTGPVDRHDSRGCGCWPEPPEERAGSSDAGLGALALFAIFLVRPRRR